MGQTFPLERPLPRAADTAVAVVQTLRQAQHEALLAGGCVRDLLLGDIPHDYDVATDARPERVCELFHATRKVGAQFGVVLVRKRRDWIEVATFRTDLNYADGRRPTGVTFTDAQHDARRRDFTINGMFLDPLKNVVVDYVNGRDDLNERLIRAIGQPAERFAEDHLRLIRAVRFAARLDFAIEPTTHAAICENAGALEKVAAERIHDELARMLTHHRRQRAFQLLWETRLLSHLWPGAAWTAGQVARANALLQALPTEADFPLALAALLSDRPLDEVHTIARALACSNEERETAAWLIDHQADLDRPSDLSLAELKRLLQHRAFANLRALTGARLADAPDRAARLGVLDQRAQSIIPAQIEPAPFVTGDDLKQLGHAPGPYFKRVLDELYTRQLNEELSERDVALAIARQLLEDGER